MFKLCLTPKEREERDVLNSIKDLAVSRGYKVEQGVLSSILIKKIDSLETSKEVVHEVLEDVELDFSSSFSWRGQSLMFSDIEDCGEYWCEISIA